MPSNGRELLVHRAVDLVLSILVVGFDQVLGVRTSFTTCVAKEPLSALQPSFRLRSLGTSAQPLVTAHMDQGTVKLAPWKPGLART